MTTMPPAPTAGAPASQRGAGVAIRAIATVVDLILLGVFFYVFDAACGEDAPGLALTGAAALLMFLVDFLYYVTFEAVWQATPGKMVCGLKIVRADDGGRIGWMEAILRTVLRVVDAFPYAIPYLVAAVVVGVLKKNQRIGDMVAKTLVVRKSGAS